ncbi:MAG: lectin-like protein [Pseudomonadota bacterium]
MMNVTLSPVQRNVLQSIQRTNDQIGQSQLFLASGRDVNSALDAPSNFFTSQSLFSQAQDLSQLLDGIGTSIRTIQEANIGVEAQLALIDQAEALVEEGLIELFPRTDETPDAEAIQYILDLNPDKAYFANTNNFYTQTADFVNWDVARDNARNAGLNGVPELTGHLATITSQEENDFVFGLLTATSWLGGSDDAVEGEWRWVEGPEAGQQFWQGLSTGGPVDGAYTNWAPGEPNQFFGTANPENFAHMRADGLWNDLPNDRNLNYIIEWGGDLLIQNPDINVSSDAMDYRRDFLSIMGQLQEIAIDASFDGVGLLQEDNLETQFTKGSDSLLKTEGIDATMEGLGLTRDNFISKSEMEKILVDLQSARKTLRDYSSSLSSDLNIIQTRRDFLEQNINTLESGGDDLTIADLNERSSELLALQTRQQLQVEVLSFTSNITILDLFS